MKIGLDLPCIIFALFVVAVVVVAASAAVVVVGGGGGAVVVVGGGAVVVAAVVVLHSYTFLFLLCRITARTKPIQIKMIWTGMA